MKGEVYLCSQCKSADVDVEAWVPANATKWLNPNRLTWANDGSAHLEGHCNAGCDHVYLEEGEGEYVEEDCCIDGWVAGDNGIQRCDECRRFACDDDAREHVRKILDTLGTYGRLQPRTWAEVKRSAIGEDDPPECGHSHCRQNWIDTGSGAHVEPEGDPRYWGMSHAARTAPLQAKATEAVNREVDEAVARCGHQGCELRPGHIPGHTDR